MRIRMTKFAVVCVTTLATLLTAETSDAGPILDWLFPKRAARRAQAQAGTVTFRVPVGAYQPNQSWSGYAPTTSYRTVWASVPVTQYRPVSYVNPLSTSGASVMRPCTTYEWQARRVPYVSYQPVTQVNPPAVAAPGMFAAPSSTPSCGSGCGTTSYYGGTGIGATPIATEWTTVGSGVSYATPPAAGSAYGVSPATVSAGYADSQTFSPIPTPTRQSYPAPPAAAAAPVCQSCPSTAPAFAQETSPPGTEAQEATPWVPLNQDRTGITPLPADTRPSLTNDAPRLLPSDGNTDLNGQGRYNQELQPVAPLREGDGSAQETGYDPTRYYGTNSPIRRPSISRDDPYRQQVLDDSVHRNDVDQEKSAYGQDPYRAAPSRSRSVPYLKPIPDLKRQQRSQWDSDPIPSHAAEDDSAERTAQRLAPQRDSVPINWSQVDIDRQGSLTRVPVQVRSIHQQTGRPQTEDEDEGGWRRARR